MDITTAEIAIVLATLPLLGMLAYGTVKFNSEPN